MVLTHPLTHHLRKPYANISRDKKRKVVFCLGEPVQGPYAEPSALHNHTNAHTLTMKQIAASQKTFTYVTMHVAAQGVSMRQRRMEHLWLTRNKLHYAVAYAELTQPLDKRAYLPKTNSLNAQLTNSQRGANYNTSPVARSRNAKRTYGTTKRTNKH